jgi:hypothetical protein
MARLLDGTFEIRVIVQYHDNTALHRGVEMIEVSLFPWRSRFLGDCCPLRGLVLLRCEQLTRRASLGGLFLRACLLHAPRVARAIAARGSRA